MLKARFFALILTWGFVPLSAHSTILLDLSKQTSKVEFFAVGKPSLIKINGTGGKLTGNLEIEKNQVKGQFKVNLDEFTTGIALRDQHMKEKYLEVSKFAEATFEIEKIELPEDFLSTKKIYSNVPFEGKFSLHGVEKKLKGIAEVDTRKDNPAVATEFKVLVSDYKINIPTYLGIKVADEVTVKTTVNLNFAKQE